MMFVASVTEPRSRSGGERDAEAYRGEGSTKKVFRPVATLWADGGGGAISALLVDDDAPRHRLFPHSLISPRKLQLQTPSYF